MPSGSDFFSLSGEQVFTRHRHLAACETVLFATLFFAAGLTPMPSAAAALPPGPTVEAVYAAHGDRMPVIDNKGDKALYEAPADTPQTDCRTLAGPRAMVVLVFGQSNASNTVDPGYGATQAVYAYQDGLCRRVRDAIPGATGAKGSAWSRLGDRIIESGLYDTVLYVDIARGGSSILNWGSRGDLHALLLETLDTLQARGLAPTHVFFHQGEADCALGLTRDEYAAVLGEVLDAVRARTSPKAGIYVARASLFLDPVCGDMRNPGCYKSCPAITAAQTAVADPAQRIFSGPNTDLLVPWFDRNDGYHFTARAADRFAAAWMPLLTDGRTANPTVQ